MRTVPLTRRAGAPDPSRYRMSAGDGFAIGIVPFIDVLLILVVLLVVLAASGGGELRALPLVVPSAQGQAPADTTAKAATFLVRPDGVAVLGPNAAPGASPEPVALPEAGTPRGDILTLYCAQAHLDPTVAVRVAAEADSRHVQLVAFLGFAQQCGIRDVEVLVDEGRASAAETAAGLAPK